jgi:LruC domain-containing protein
MVGLLASLLGLSGASPARAQDQDGDGTADATDVFPCDASRASVTYFPSETATALLSFEDQWPGPTDLDFNDVAVRVHYRVERRSDGRAVSLHASFDVLALGGDLTNGLGLQLPVSSGAVAAVRRVGAQAPESLALESDASATVVLSPNLRELYGFNPGRINALEGVPRSGSVRLGLDVTFSPPADLDGSLAPFDLFIFRAGTVPRHEIHFPQYSGTLAMNQALFGTGQDASTPGRRFVHSSGTPAALALSTTLHYPLEGVAISELFPDIVLFASSRGAQAREFFTTNVVPSRGHAVLMEPPPQMAAPDTSCLMRPCGGQAHGSTWWAWDGNFVDEPMACACGGDLASRYQREAQLVCTNAVVSATGTTRAGALLGQVGACNSCAPTSCFANNGSSWVSRPINSFIWGCPGCPMRDAAFNPYYPFGGGSCGNACASRFDHYLDGSDFYSPSSASCAPGTTCWVCLQDCSPGSQGAQNGLWQCQTN